MTILAIDTAANICACALFDQQSGQTIAEKSEDLGRGHAERLVPMIEEVMADAESDFAALKKIAVTVGPGSFTGIRVGVAAARGYGLALKIPVAGVTTLRALACQAVRTIAQSAKMVVAIHGGRNQLFMQHFDGKANALDDPIACQIDQASDHLRDDVALVVGNAGAELEPSYVNTRQSVLGDRATADISAIARLAPIADMAPVPLYLRDADAKPQTGFALPRARTAESG